MSFNENTFESWMLNFNAEINYRNMIEGITEKGTVYGVKEFDQIEKWVFNKSSPFLSTLPTNTSLYRARKINVEDINQASSGIVATSDELCGYNEENSRECPLCISPAGRNNIVGQSYLYVADSETTACAEIKAPLRSLISIATFSPTRTLEIIDFSEDVSFPEGSSKECGVGLGAFFTRLMMNFSEPVVDEKDYLATQIIADYIRKTGIDGLAYKSFYTGGTNYTIFNSSPKIIAFKQSKIVIHQYCNNAYWDFSNKQALFSYPENMDYDEDMAAKMIDSLSKQNG